MNTNMRSKDSLYRCPFVVRRGKFLINRRAVKYIGAVGDITLWAEGEIVLHGVIGKRHILSITFTDSFTEKPLEIETTDLDSDYIGQGIVEDVYSLLAKKFGYVWAGDSHSVGARKLWARLSQREDVTCCLYNTRYKEYCLPSLQERARDGEIAEELCSPDGKNIYTNIRNSPWRICLLSKRVAKLLNLI